MYMFWYYRDDEIEVESIRPVRNNLCDLMNVPRQVLKKVFFTELRNQKIVIWYELFVAQFYQIMFLSIYLSYEQKLDL